MRVIRWDKQPDPKSIAVTLVAQNPKELQYLNRLIRNGKALASGDSYEVVVTLSEGKTVENFEHFLSTKRGFKIEE